MNKWPYMLIDESSQRPCWAEMDTTYAEQFSDQELLRFAAAAQIGNGYGNVAELFKRFASARGIT